MDAAVSVPPYPDAGATGPSEETEPGLASDPTANATSADIPRSSEIVDRMVRISIAWQMEGCAISLAVVNAGLPGCGPGASAAMRRPNAKPDMDPRRPKETLIRLSRAPSAQAGPLSASWSGSP